MPEQLTKVSRRRVRRVFRKLGPWLRRTHGHRRCYSREQIDRGCEELGYRASDDLLLAYALFGSDLMPDIVLAHSDAVSVATWVADVRDVISEASIADWLGDDELF